MKSNNLLKVLFFYFLIFEISLAGNIEFESDNMKIFEEGNIFIKDSTLNWKDAILINLNNIHLIMENNRLKFSGTISFDFKDIKWVFLDISPAYAVGTLSGRIHKINIDRKRLNGNALKVKK